MRTVLFNETKVAPTKIVCVGRNYVEHIQELGNERPDQPVVFCKPNSAIAELPSVVGADSVHYEAEISFLCMDGKYAGVGVGLDLTKREVQDSLRRDGLPWERAKAFDGSAVFSEFASLPEGDAPIGLELKINGIVAQQADSTMMIYSPSEILTEISTFMTLEDYDIVMTGTPSGVGPLRVGYHLAASVSRSGQIIARAEWTVA